MKKVSVVICTYNGERYLREQLDSILAQTYPVFEVVVQDDCSTDGTVEIVQQYVDRDPRIKLFRLERNSGAGVCRNRSIQEAQGRFIAFCDSDDCWKPEKLERQLAFMEKMNCALSYTAYMTCDENSHIMGIVVGRKKETFFSMTCDDGIGCLTAIYDTQKVGKIFMPDLRKRQDWGLWLKVLEKCRVAYGMKDPLAVYRIHSTSISRNKFSLIQYNLNVYKTVLRYSVLKSYLYFTFLFLPSYFFKKLMLRYINR